SAPIGRRSGGGFGRRGGAPGCPRRGRAPLARLRRPVAEAPPGRPRWHRHAGQGRPAEADALVRRAARGRPAPVPRRRASAAPRPAGSGRSVAGRARGGALAGPVRVAVCRPQVPFARGGAEIFTDRLVDELRVRGHDADLVSVPFKWYPGARVLTQAFLWRMLDLDEADGQRIDVVVATKFPSYLVRHRDKRVWLVHQFRQAYELDGTALGQFGDSPEDRAIRRKVQALDHVALGEATRLFAISKNVAGRVASSTGLEAEVLPHPP